jgi:hypothetical protein
MKYYNLKLENIKSIENKELKSTKKNKSYIIPKGLLFQYVLLINNYSKKNKTVQNP